MPNEKYQEDEKNNVLKRDLILMIVICKDLKLTKQIVKRIYIYFF